MAVPVSIGQLGHIMMGVVDSIMVGNVGAVQLAAASLVNGLFALMLVLGIGMTLAITPLVAIAKGSKNFDECGVVLRQSLIVNTLFSFLLVLMIFGISYLIKYLDQPIEVVAEAESYIRILGFSLIPVMLFQSYRQFLEGLSFVRPPMLITIIANVFNGFFNWIFIYGNLGFEAMGLDGAGWATLLTRSLMAAALVAHVLSSRKYKRFDPTFNYKKLDLPIMKKIVNIGLPSGLQYFLEVGAFAFGAIMIGWIGSIQLAAHQIAINLASVSYMIVLGIATAGTIRVGNYLGEENYVETRRSGFAAIILAVSIMGTFGASFIILRKFLPTLYISEEPVIALASSLLIVAGLFQLSDGTQATGLGVLRGLTDVKIPTLYTFVAYWIIGIPVAYIFGFWLDLGAIGVWIGFSAGLTVIALLLLYRFHRKTRQTKLT